MGEANIKGVGRDDELSGPNAKLVFFGAGFVFPAVAGIAKVLMEVGCSASDLAPGCCYYHSANHLWRSLYCDDHITAP